MPDLANPSQVEAFRQQWIDSLPKPLDGSNKILDLTNANPALKADVLKYLGVDLDNLLAKGVELETVQVRGGAENGGVSYEYINTLVPGILVEMEFNDVMGYIDRQPSAVAMVNKKRV